MSGKAKSLFFAVLVAITIGMLVSTCFVLYIKLHIAIVESVVKEDCVK